MKRLFLLLLLFIVFAAIPARVKAQHPAFYSINDESGLPSNEVYRVVQDSFGYIWIGCDAGLFRYDGFTFKPYLNSRQNGRAVSFLMLDNKQRIWAKNFFGQIYRVEDDSLRIIFENKTAQSSHPQFAIDAACNLWTYRDQTILCYSENGDSLDSYVFPQVHVPISSLSFFNEKVYVIYENLTVMQLDRNGKQSQCIQLSLAGPNEINNAYPVIHNGKLLLLVETINKISDYHIFEVTPTGLKLFKEIDEPDNRARIYSIYSDGVALWMTTSFGAMQVQEQSVAPVLFSDQKVSFMMRDREGSHWFSTLHNGIFVIPELDVIKLNTANTTLNENNITCISGGGPGKMIIGTYLGRIYEMALPGYKPAEKYDSRDENLRAVKTISWYPDYTFISRGRLCIIDNKTGRQYFPGTSNLRDFARVGDTLFGVHAQKTVHFGIRQLVENKLTGIDMFSSGGKAIEYDSAFQTLFFAFGEGTFYREKGKLLTELRANNEPVYANAISCSNGITWIATANRGVFGFEKAILKFHYDASHLLRDNSARTLYATPQHVWVCTDNYLIRIRPATGEAAYFGQSNSVNPKDINNITVQDGMVYLATNKGVLIFPEKLGWKNSTVPNIRIDRVSAAGGEVLPANGQEFPYGTGDLQIHFSATAFRCRGNFTYAYRLAGTDSSWTILPASSPQVQFSQLAAGSYRFQVRAINENGISSRTEEFVFRIATPFWQRWWFYVLLMIAGLAITTLVFILRIRSINRKAELKNKMILSQMAALKSQMNPHFMFNALNSIQDLVIQQDIKNSNYYLGKFSKLMRKILHASDSENHALQDEIEFLELYLDLEKLRFGDDFTYTITVDPALETDEIRVPSMIIQPFVENAMKHGLLHKSGTKTLHIDFSLRDKLICTVTDNGVGRKRAAEIKNRAGEKHRSFATGATQQRLDLLNTSVSGFGFKIIDLEKEGIAAGTQVVIYIPLRYS
jgi:ligand-binding sensor domain-containing protein